MTDVGAPCHADMHAHFLLYGHYLRQGYSGAGRRWAPWGPLGNRLLLEHALAGQVHCVTFTVYVPAGRWFGVGAALRQIDTLDRVAAETGGRLTLARTGAQVRAIAASGRVAGVVAIEGGHALERDPSDLERLAARGVRMATLAHFVSSSLADVAACAYRPHGGLSHAGRDVVRRMGRLGMFPDVAHLSDAAIDQATVEAEGPVVCSHTGMRSLRDLPRNLGDAQARRIAATGGMIGILWFPPYLSDAFLGRDATIQTFLDHCCHAASVVGPGHVGIGTDLDALTWPPAGLRDHRDYPRVADGLRQRGFSAAEVDGILGRNYLLLLGDGGVASGS